MAMSAIYTRTATCDDCGYKGSLAALELHSCAIQESGGRCEDYPCCGHTDGDGCQTLPEHTSAYWLELRQTRLHDSYYGTGAYACGECGYMHDSQEDADACGEECGGELPEPVDIFDDYYDSDYGAMY